MPAALTKVLTHWAAFQLGRVFEGPPSRIKDKPATTVRIEVVARLIVTPAHCRMLLPRHVWKDVAATAKPCCLPTPTARWNMETTRQSVAATSTTTWRRKMVWHQNIPIHSTQETNPRSYPQNSLRHGLHWAAQKTRPLWGRTQPQFAAGSVQCLGWSIELQSNKLAQQEEHPQTWEEKCQLQPPWSPCTCQSQEYSNLPFLQGRE